MPAVVGNVMWGGYDLQTGAYYLNMASNELPMQYKTVAAAAASASSAPRNWPTRARADDVAIMRSNPGTVLPRGAGGAGVARRAGAASAGANAATVAAAAPGGADASRPWSRPKALGAAMLAVAARRPAAGGGRRARHRAAVGRRTARSWRQASGAGAGQPDGGALRRRPHRLGGRATWAWCCTAPTAARPGASSSTASRPPRWCCRRRRPRPERASAQAEAQRLVDDGPDKPFFDLYFDRRAQRLSRSAPTTCCSRTVDGGATWQPWRTACPTPRACTCTACARTGSGSCTSPASRACCCVRPTAARASAPSPSPYKGSFFGLLAARSGALLAYGLRGNAFCSADQGASWQQGRHRHARRRSARRRRTGRRHAGAGQPGRRRAAQRATRAAAFAAQAGGAQPPAGRRRRGASRRRRAGRGRPARPRGRHAAAPR